jgi:hypothetical protein
MIMTMRIDMIMKMWMYILMNIVTVIIIVNSLIVKSWPIHIRIVIVVVEAHHFCRVKIKLFLKIS